MDFVRNLNKYEILCFCIMIAFALICTIKMALFCMSGGVLAPDSILYSITALKYAGLDYYNIANPNEIFSSPVISFLTSLLFRIGFVDKNAIIIVSAILCFFGYVGLYFLFKIRFNSMLSLIGVIILGSTSVMIFNLSKGLIDIPALALVIWTFYFSIKAIDKDPKYFLIALPLLVLSIFTKYVVGGFAIPIILLYYCFNKNIVGLLDSFICDRPSIKEKFMNYIHSREFKFILAAIAISAVLAVIICKTLILDYGGTFGFIQQTASTVNINSKVALSKIYNPVKSYYIKNFSIALYQYQEFSLYLAYLLYGIIICGILINLINIIKNIDSIKSQMKSFKTKHFEKFMIGTIILLMLVSFYGFKVLSNNMVSNIPLIFAIILLQALLTKFPFNEKKLSLDLFFLTYLLITLIFFSLFPEKTYRYILPTIMAFIYFVVWGLDSIFIFLNKGFDSEKRFETEISKKINYSNLSKIISIVLIIGFLISTFSFIMPMEFDRENTVYFDVLYKGYSNDLDDACDFIIQNVPDYHSKSFAAFKHSSRTVKWNLNTNVTILYDDDPQLLDFDETDYLILYKNIKFKNYHKIHTCGDFYIYAHD